MGLPIHYCRVSMFTRFPERLCRLSVIRLPPLGYPIAAPRQPEWPRLYVLRPRRLTTSYTESRFCHFGLCVKIFGVEGKAERAEMITEWRERMEKAHRTIKIILILCLFQKYSLSNLSCYNFSKPIKQFCF